MRYQQNLLKAYRSRGLLDEDAAAASAASFTHSTAAVNDSGAVAAAVAVTSAPVPPDGFSSEKNADRPSRPPLVMPLDHFHGPSFHALLNDYRADNARPEMAGDGELEEGGAEAEVEGGAGSGVGVGAANDVADGSGGRGGGARSPPLTLPIDAHREKILKHVRNNRVTVIHGETGSGKSSRLPVMLIEDAMERGGRRAKMFVSQPRRAATRALAQRVREEAKESGGKWNVAMRLGHGVREGPRGAEVTFATTGYIVRLIANSPGLLDSHTHLIIDEVGGWWAGVRALAESAAVAAVVAVAATWGRTT